MNTGTIKLTALLAFPWFLIPSQGERLLISREHSLHLLNAKSGEEKLLHSQPALWIQYDPRANHVFFFAFNNESGYKFVRTDLNGTKIDQSDLPFLLHSCIRWNGRDKSYIPDYFISMALDRISGNLYMSNKCGVISICNFFSSNCATIRQIPESRASSLVLQFERRILFWTEGVSIIRASMDGSSVRTIFSGKPPSLVTTEVVRRLAVDSSKIYSTIPYSKGIERCNFDGSEHEVLSLETVIHSFVLGVHRHWIYWLELRKDDEEYTIRRGIMEHVNSTVVYVARNQLNRVIVLPEDQKLEGVHNPCERNNCSHLCVQSERPGKFSCLCEQGFSIHSDGTTCVDDRIVVATSSGIVQLSLEGKAAQANDVREASPIISIASDTSRGRILWAEELSNGVGIYSRDVLEPTGNKRWMVWQPGDWPVLDSKPELQAFSVDWITGNVYMAFRHHRRIYACNQLTTLCTELLGNQVTEEIRGLALHPAQGMMFWIQRQGQTSWSVVKAPMDSRNGPPSLVTKSGLREPRGVAVDYIAGRVFWLDALAEVAWADFDGGNHDSISVTHKNFIPQRVRIYEGTLYWSGNIVAGTDGAIFKVGITGQDFEDEHGAEVREELVGNFSSVQDFAVYHTKMQLRARRDVDDGHKNCSGLNLLLSRPGGFTCACSKELIRSSDGNCTAIQDPRLFYRKPPLELIFRSKNGSENSMVTVASQVWSMTYDHGRNEVFWTGVHEQSQNTRGNGTKSTVGIYNTLIHKLSLGHTPERQDSDLWHQVPYIGKAWPIIWMEYDWVGDNIFFANILGSIGLCSRVTAHCTEIRNRTGLTGFEIGSKLVALDPRRGRMYWFTKGKMVFGYAKIGIATTGMDGSDLKMVLEDVNVHALAIDQESASLYWVQKVAGGSASGGYNVREIMYSDLNGRNVQKVISTADRNLLGLTLVGDLMYWWETINYSQILLYRCAKRTANDLNLHEIQIEPDGTPNRSRLFLFLPRRHPAKSKNPCSGGLCSHICAPSPNRYMRCLCPPGFTLMPNGWSCECTNITVCNNTDEKHNILRHGAKSTYEAAQTIAVLQRNCAGDDAEVQYPCHTIGVCVPLSLICDGAPDCADYSDEGPLCNDPCPLDFDCSFKCTQSPTGPICICPAGEILDDDMKKCIKPDRRLAVALLVVGILSIALAMLSVFAVVKYRRTKRGQRKLTLQEVEDFLRGDPAGVEIATAGIDRAVRLPYKHILPLESVIIAKDTVLGSGEFGTVHPGFFNGEAVAIKTLKSTVDIEEFKGILAEIKIMAYLGYHEHLIKFLGAEVSRIRDRKVLVLTELSPYGDLLKYLQKVSSIGLGVQQSTYENIIEPELAVTSLTLVQWCAQIAAGMEYLSTKQVVHGDLAARNVLVFKRNIVKIADFGLSKQLEGNALYTSKRKGKLPWKWCSIELLKHMEFSEASDVWAFGVTAWEIFSLGMPPYKGKRFSQEFIDFLESGNRLPEPVHASKQVYEILLECWNQEVHLRPNFSTLRNFFSEQHHVSVEITNSSRSDEYVDFSHLPFRD